MSIRTPDDRHVYEKTPGREELAEMELDIERLWTSGDISDTDEENPALADLLKAHDALEKKIYGTDDPFANMDEEEDWDDEEEKSKLTKAEKREAAEEAKRDKLTLSEQIAGLERDGLPKEIADALREKYKSTIAEEARGVREPKRKKKTKRGKVKKKRAR